jgi:hypothetical protein
MQKIFNLKTLLIIAAFLASQNAFAAGFMGGKITRMMAGADSWFGVRFYVAMTNNQTAGICNPEFAYTEPELGSGHKDKVAVFTAAYLAGKNVLFTVAPGRNGYCRIFEGEIN